MDSQEVVGLLQECLRAATSADQLSTQPTETEKRNYCSCRGQTQDGAILCFVSQTVKVGILVTISYISCRLAVCRTGLSPAGGNRHEVALCAWEVAVQTVNQCHRQIQSQWPCCRASATVTGISKNLTNLFFQSKIHFFITSLLGHQALLKTSIVAQEASTALAVVFLVDRFLYWTDESSRLLKITRLLHRCHPNTPVAPQLIIRQARVYLNSGMVFWTSVIKHAVVVVHCISCINKSIVIGEYF